MFTTLPQIPLEVLQNPSFWTTVAFVLFIILVYKPIKRTLRHYLEQRRQNITNDIQQAVQLEYQADNLLQDMREQYEQAQKTAEEDLANARSMTERMQQDALANLAKTIARKEQKAQEHILHLEKKAIATMKEQTLARAIDAAQDILRKRLTKQDHEKMLTKTLQAFKTDAFKTK